MLAALDLDKKMRIEVDILDYATGGEGLIRDIGEEEVIRLLK